MRIAFIITGLARGGAETMLLKLLSAMDLNRFHCTVVSLSSRHDLVDDFRALGIDIRLVKSASFLGLIRLLRTIRQLKPDLIQGWMLHGNLAAYIIGRILAIPVLWGVRHSRLSKQGEGILNTWIERVLAYVSKNPRLIIYNSCEGRRQHELLGYEKGKGAVIPNGFDLDHFAPSLSKRHARRQTLNVATDAVLIGMFARFHPMKDHATFIEAAARLAKSHENVVYVLAGKGCDATNERLMSRIRHHALAQRFRLLGECKDIDYLANALDVGTLSSSSAEGFPNCIGELMATGVPCVVTNVGDLSKIIGDCGIVVTPNAPSDLFLAWKRLVEMDVNDRRELGLRARERIARMFSMRTVAREYEEKYLGTR
jgi:glycosyltransferase involved in cell wall biosynthesis